MFNAPLSMILKKLKTNHMKTKFSYKSFMKRYPNDDERLFALLNARTGSNRSCLNPSHKNGNIDRDYKRLRNKKALLCNGCLLHVHPLVDGPFDHSRLNLAELFEITFKELSASSGMSHN